MPDAPDWDRDGADWPHREASRFVVAGDLRWHLQQMGQGPALLLVHGTGAATHSWRRLAPLLAKHFAVLAPDLPGHGFTAAAAAQGLSLPGMANLLKALLRELGVSPVLAVGHSAGAAILARMSLDGDFAARGLVSLNGALLPLRGVEGHIASPVARLLSSTSVAARLFSWRARDRIVVERLMAGTGSRLEETDLKLYWRLGKRPGHVASALAMMANWDLRPLVRDLPELKPKLVLVAARNDRMISRAVALQVRALVPGAVVETLPRLGHLAHEEDPEVIAGIVLELARDLEVLPAT